jgi:hypothetical protein
LCDSYGFIFENHTLGEGNAAIRTGVGYRAQCEGNLWELGLLAWIEVEKERREKEKKSRKAAEPRQKRRKVDADQEDANHKQLELKLWMGLGLLKCLAENIHTGVNKNNPEPGVAADIQWKLKDCSLLVSTPCPLERYPAPRNGLPDKTQRFPAEIRAKPPPKEAAPAAVKGRLLS